MGVKFFKNPKKLEKLRIKLQKKVEPGHGYSILRSSKTLKESEYLMELSKQYDDYGYMSDELGDELDELFLDDDYIIGIHRTGYTPMDDKTIDDIFSKGLINNGHIMQGGGTGNYSIENTVSLFYDFTIMNGQLKAAHGYKGSMGCVIVKIPKSYLGKKDGDIKPIYYIDGGVVKLLPEFVYGYVSVNEKGELGRLINNPKYKDSHDLNNDNLYYDEAGYYKAKKEGISLDKKEIPLEDKYEIIKKAYMDTLLKYGDYQAEQALLHLINDNEVKYFTGSENRAMLNKYIVYGNVLSILSFGTQSEQVNDIISNFISSIKEELETKNRHI